MSHIFDMIRKNYKIIIIKVICGRYNNTFTFLMLKHATVKTNHPSLQTFSCSKVIVIRVFTNGVLKDVSIGVM